MSVSDGQKANQISFNDAFLSRINNSDTIAKIDLKNQATDPASGTDVLNIQRELNGLNSLISDTPQVNQPADRKPTWASNVIGSANQAVKERVDSVQGVVQTNRTELENVRLTTGTLFGSQDMGAYTPGVNVFALTDDESIKTNIQELVVGVDERILLSEKAQPNGVATLDGSGLVPANQLPSFVDDVLEFANFASFPAIGETGKIYVALDTNLTYRWSGSTYIEISANQVNSVNGQMGVVVLDTDDVPEGAANLYYTDVRADGRVTAGIAAASIDDLIDVDTSTTPPAIDQALVWNGTNFVPQDQTGSGGGGGGAAGRLFFEDRATAEIANVLFYNDGASAVPVDGTGGTATVLAALNLLTPITGESSYELEKGVGDKLGQGWAIETDVPLDLPVKQGESITVQFRYQTDVDYADGDVRMFYYLVGDNQLFALNGIDGRAFFGNALNKNDSGSGQFTASLNATNLTTSIRLIAHIATTETLNYKIKLDEVTIGTASQLVSVEKREQTISLIGSGNFTAGEIRISKIGNQVSILNTVPPTHASLSSASSAAGLIPEWARPQATSVINLTNFGGTLVFRVEVTTTGVLTVVYRDWAGNLTATTGGSSIGAITFPVAETASNIISSTQAAFENPALRALGNPPSAAVNTPIILGAKPVDNYNAYSTITGLYTAPKKENYLVHGVITSPTPGVTVSVWRNSTLQNTVGITNSSGDCTFSGFVNADAGDTISIRPSATLDASGVILNINAIPNLSVVGLAGRKQEIISTASALTTMINSNAFQSFVGNSVPLPEGIWSIDGELYAVSESNTIRFDRLSGQYGNVNASGSLGAPITVLTNSQNYAVIDNRLLNAYREILIPMPNIVVRTTSTQSIFLNPQLGFANGTNHRVLVRINARRLA